MSVLACGFLLVAIATWLAPRRYFIYLIWWVVIVGMVGWLARHQLTQAESRDYLFQLGFFQISVAVAAVILAARAAYLLFIRGRTAESSGRTETTPPTILIRFSSITTGATAAFAGAFALASAMEGYQPAWAAPVVALIVVLTTVASGTLLHRRRQPNNNFAKATADVLLGFGGASAAVIVIAVAMGFYLRNNIEIAAGGHPYCVQIADDGHSLRPLPTLLDLSLLSQGSLLHPGLEADAPALIVQSNDRLFGLDWPHAAYRYRSSPREQELSDSTPVFCNPRPDFLRGIPAVKPAANAPLTMRIGKQVYAIPANYSPSGRSGYYGSLAFKVDESTLRQPPTDGRASITVLAIWNPQQIKEQLSVDNLNVLASQEMFGLQSASDEKGRQTYYRTNGSGRAMTLIVCDKVHTSRCEHAFADEIGLTSFSYPQTELSRWQSLQNNLSALVSSWRLSNPNSN